MLRCVPQKLVKRYDYETLDHFVNTAVHLLNNEVGDIIAKFSRYSIWRLAQDLLKFWCAVIRFAHSQVKHNGDHIT